MKRQDWMKAIKTPVGIIPGGTGNALAESLEMNVITSVLTAIKGYTRPIDLCRVTQGSQHYWSFLGIHWGYICDTDKESEHLRFLGDLRYTLYSLKLLSELREYEGTFSYLPTDYSATEECSPSLYNCSICQGNKNMIEEKKENRSTDVKTENTSTNKKSGYKGYIFKEYTKDEENSSSIFPSIITHSDYSNPPENWKTIKGKFFFWVSGNIRSIAKNTTTFPYAHLSDGYIDVVWTHQGSKRKEILKAILNVEDGSYVHHSIIESIKTKAFTLIPGKSKEGKESVIAVDGESIPYQPIGVECFQGLGTILCPPPPMMIPDHEYVY